jgi:antagonist of KipI
MSTIRVQSPGLLTTVQDLGREGFGPLGVSPSGAADPISLRLGNRLVGNVEGAPALEMTLLGGTFLFPDGAIVALTGSDFGATLDDAPVAAGVSIKIYAGQTIRCGSTRSGARCYLCVQGGIAVPHFLHSASTHLLSGLGGFEGRPLRKGDVLQIAAAGGGGTFCTRKIASHIQQNLAACDVLRVTRGPQADRFTVASLREFHENAYRVTEQADRIGIRLDGLPVRQTADRPMITEGVSLGAIQIPPGGSPIILFVEQQTTGGYPKIANVIAADLHRLGQLRPRDQIRFEEVTFETARALLIEQEKSIASGEWILE